ncbi:unnamed protein product [Durusdinium trenchii]|uniref:Uncharacterized protein n=1 Tax=Durusdinium trenchii TaxID=1381693 RepID=A0ABP0KLY8_9DINO
MELPTPILLNISGAGESTTPTPKSLFHRAVKAASLALDAIPRWTGMDLAVPGPLVSHEALKQESAVKDPKQRKVRFQEPDIIEVPSWKDETRQMYFNSAIDQEIRPA